MLSQLPDNFCIPFVWMLDDADTGPRVGGMPPEGVMPPVGEDTRYVMTLSIEAELELSIFAQRSRHIFEPNAFYPRHHAGEIFENHDVFSFVLHGPSRRSQAGSEYASELPSCRIEYLVPISDTLVARHPLKEEMKGPFQVCVKQAIKPGEEPTRIYFPSWECPSETVVWEITSEAGQEPCDGSKFGGRPAFLCVKPCRQLDARLSEKGYSFFLQLGPGSDNEVVTNGWPLEDCGMTFVYIKKSGRDWEWSYFWAE